LNNLVAGSHLMYKGVSEMRTGRPLSPLSVSQEQRATLENWARRPKTGQALALRARIVLACAEGKPNGVVA
jgi:hypothetical protein